MDEKRIALSLREPHARAIFDGTKTIEYRTWPTRKRGLVYIYATLPCGRIIGTVEITDCQYNEPDEIWEWALANPQPCEPFKPKKHPQPGFFYID